MLRERASGRAGERATGRAGARVVIAALAARTPAARTGGPPHPAGVHVPAAHPAVTDEARADRWSARAVPAPGRQRANQRCGSGAVFS
jgi:hypothetical protein